MKTSFLATIAMILVSLLGMASILIIQVIDAL